MEATRESQSLIEKIKPPRLEDAGLEDCALPPDLIKEAFLKAASAIRSITSDDEPRCVDDPWEYTSDDALVGITEGVNAPSSGCAVEKGRGMEGNDDLVVVGQGVVGKEACVDGLEIEGKSEGILGNKDDEEEEEEEEEEVEILVEGVV